MDSRDVQQQHTRDLSESYIERTTTTTTNLLDLLSNTLVIHQTLPYLPVSALLHLAATSRSFRDLILGTPGAFRHLDLTRVKSAQFDFDNRAIDRGGEIWRNVQVDENLTEDDFYSGPLRGIFQNIRRRGDILRDVQTLVLDGLSVTAELVNDILVDHRSFRVRVLSLREVKNLNEERLMQSLKFACRQTRPEGTPCLKALYVFGKKDAPVPPGATAPPAAGTNGTLAAARAAVSGGSGANISTNWNHKSQHALKEAIRTEGDEWYHKRGRMISRSINDRWAEAMLDCRETIRFDAVLCTGPRHQNSPVFGKVPFAAPGGKNAGHRTPWAVATFAVGGCASCGAAPEGFTVHGDSPAEMLPLLSPVPLHSSTIKSATCPRNIQFEETPEKKRQPPPSFVPRCLECIRERYCFSCDQWWCESCYQVPSREELANAQHVHIVDDNSTNSLVFHEMAAFEQPKVKVRMGYCIQCNIKSVDKEKRKRNGHDSEAVRHNPP
ncbi:hypothetical protein SLS62_010611 [Diatrype stigma]|uniref:Ubiquitin fusion degradation protein n=1 Tax=Diatrype stigma TaxID=117547 RepID=A0AAN9YHP4_9PEZI